MDPNRKLLSDSTYPLVTVERFPYGVRCHACHRIIQVGQPYSESLEGILDGIPVVMVTCVYYPECRLDTQTETD